MKRKKSTPLANGLKERVNNLTNEVMSLKGVIAQSEKRAIESEKQTADIILRFEAAQERGFKVIAHAQKVEMMLGFLADVTGGICRAVQAEKIAR